LDKDFATDAGEPRVGAAALSTTELQSLRQDLAENPPQEFDIARRMNVFNSYFEFVELELSGVHIDRKRIQIPAHLMGVADQKTRDQISSHFQVVPEGSVLSGEKLRKDRDLIAKRFMRVIPTFGTVVRRSEKTMLVAEVEALKKAVGEFRTKLKAE